MLALALMKVVPVLPPKLSRATVPSWQPMHSLLLESRSPAALPNSVNVELVSAWFHNGAPSVLAAKCGVWHGLQISPCDQPLELKSWLLPTIPACALAASMPIAIRAMAATSSLEVFIR